MWHCVASFTQPSFFAIFKPMSAHQKMYLDWRDDCPNVAPPAPYPAACQRCLMLNEPGTKTCALCSTPLPPMGAAAAPAPAPGGLHRAASGSSSSAEVIDLTKGADPNGGGGRRQRQRSPPVKRRRGDKGVRATHAARASAAGRDRGSGAGAAGAANAAFLPSVFDSSASESDDDDDAAGGGAGWVFTVPAREEAAQATRDESCSPSVSPSPGVGAAGGGGGRRRSGRRARGGSQDSAQSSGSPGEMWTDPDFPPDASSLDGRRRGKGGGDSADSSEEETLLGGPGGPRSRKVVCHCRPPENKAKLCTVAKDGPNQGRFFWGCPRRVAAARCGFFRWADDAPHSARDRDTPWQRKRPALGYAFVRATGESSSSSSGGGGGGGGGKAPAFRAADVRQGGVGDCWFLSAVATVAERPRLMARVFPGPPAGAPRAETLEGRYRVRLFLDGRWRVVEVDDWLPVRRAPAKAGKKALAKKGGGGGGVQSVLTVGGRTLGMTAGAGAGAGAGGGHHDLPLRYSAAVARQLWVPLLEKAYAKAHGSYKAIAGGWVTEALHDLTACPVETVSFRLHSFDAEAFWAQLLAYHAAGFPMGAGVPSSAKGLVGGHAYSVLDVRDLGPGVTVGAQPTLDAFFPGGAGAGAGAAEPYFSDDEDRPGDSHNDAARRAALHPHFVDLSVAQTGRTMFAVHHVRACYEQLRAGQFRWPRQPVKVSRNT